MAHSMKPAKWILGALLALCMHAGFALAALTDVTSHFSVAKSGLVLNRATNTFDQVITLTNNSATRILGPLSLTISGLPPTVTLTNAAGTTANGQLYVSVPTSALGLGPTERASNIVLKFANPMRSAFTYVPRILGDATTFGNPAEWSRFEDPTTGIGFGYATFGPTGTAVSS